MHKNNVIRNKCIVLCTLIICLGLCFTIFKYVVSKILVEKIHMDNYFTRIVVDDDSLFIDKMQDQDKDNSEKIYNWSELYPIEQNMDNVAGEIKHINVFSSQDKTPADRLDYWSKNNFLFYHAFLENSKYFEEFLGWREIPVKSPSNHSPAMKLSNEYLIYTASRRNMNERGEKTESFYKWCYNMNIPFLYVQLPTKVAPSYLSSDHAEKIDKCNENYDEFIKYLREKKVPCIDIRDNIINENIDWHSLFFKTDHHWTLEAGLWASNIIANTINDKYNFYLDYDRIKKENFISEVYKNVFLGSIGKKLLLHDIELDDIVLMYPKYETDIEYRVMSDDVDINKKGDFSVYYNKKILDRKNDYDTNTYCIYGYDHSVNYFCNRMSNNDYKVLLLVDSYSLTVIPFLGLTVNEICAIDLRMFNGSIKKYIFEYKPDIVVVMYGDSQRDDNESIVDFR